MISGSARCDAEYAGATGLIKFKNVKGMFSGTSGVIADCYMQVRGRGAGGVNQWCLLGKEEHPVIRSNLLVIQLGIFYCTYSQNRHVCNNLPRA